jgi:hypothetical protein
MRRLPVILLAVHSALVVLMAAAIYGFVQAGCLEAVQLWAPLALVDLPMTPILAFADPYIRSYVATGTIAEWVYLPAIEFLFAGGVMWYLVGWAIRRVWHKSQLERAEDETSSN